MAGRIDDNSKKRKALLARYNMIPNLVWSVICLTPILIFCSTLIELKLVYIFLAISIIPLFLKNSFLDRIQIGKTTKIYKKLGVDKLNRIIQNGDIINDLLKKKFPEHKILRSDKRSISSLISQTYIFEKFHFLLFIFFSLIFIYALAREYWVWALILMVTNVAFNIYPNLLQQYIRIKLSLFRKIKSRPTTNLSNH